MVRIARGARLKTQMPGQESAPGRRPQQSNFRGEQHEIYETTTPQAGPRNGVSDGTHSGGETRGVKL